MDNKQAAAAGIAVVAIIALGLGLSHGSTITLSSDAQTAFRVWWTAHENARTADEKYAMQVSAKRALVVVVKPSMVPGSAPDDAMTNWLAAANAKVDVAAHVAKVEEETSDAKALYDATRKASADAWASFLKTAGLNAAIAEGDTP